MRAVGFVDSRFCKAYSRAVHALGTGAVNLAEVSAMRQRMIGENPKSSPQTAAMYERVMATAVGQAAARKYRQFWGIEPDRYAVIETPGPKSKVRVLVGMGSAGRGGKIRRPDGSTMAASGAKLVAMDPAGKRLFMLTGKDSRAPVARLSKVGVVEETHYVPTANMERRGTFKKNKYWVHRHDDEGGSFPAVFRDQAGNYVYGPGTYSVDKWIRR